MNLDSLEKILISKSGSLKEFPFDDKTMVFKVANKMFALIMTEANPLKSILNQIYMTQLLIVKYINV
jgi:predicted DNA-binding protein (MmcQ/YjbR family)